MSLFLRRNDFSPRLQKLILNHRIPGHIIANIKQATVRCIGNLCMDNPENRLVAAQMDAVYLIVQCGRRIEMDRPFLVRLLYLFHGTILGSMGCRFT